jgi:hypothetical protein
MSPKGVGETREAGAGEALVSGVAETGGSLTGSTEDEGEGRADAEGDTVMEGKSVSRLLAGTTGPGPVGMSTSMLAS